MALWHGWYFFIYNKTDYGLALRRNILNDLVEVYIQKVKFSHLGEIGRCNFWFTKSNKRYTEALTENREDAFFDDSPLINFNGEEKIIDFQDDPIGSFNGIDAF